MIPKLDVPYYEIELPSNKKRIKYRPFLVKEEKILLMALESKDPQEYLRATKQILSNCVLDEDVLVENLPSFDIEYLFLNIRAKSVNEVSELSYTCNNIVGEGEDAKECGGELKLTINLTELTVDIPDNHSSKVELTDKVGIQMKYPTLEFALIGATDIENAMNVILNCIDYIWDENEVYYAKDMKREELVEFIDGLTGIQFKKLESFFDSIPKIKQEFQIPCKKCGFVHTIKMDGLNDFF